MLSDGQHYVTAMLTSQLNTLVQSNDLAKFSVLRIKEYFSNQVQGRKCVPPTQPSPDPHSNSLFQILGTPKLSFAPRPRYIFRPSASASALVCAFHVLSMCSCISRVFTRIPAVLSALRVWPYMHSCAL
jgi:hypothetical protein